MPAVLRTRSSRRPSEAIDNPEDFHSSRAAIKPDDQVRLNEQELKEEFTKVLTSNNPHAPQNIVRYDYKERQYKLIPQVDQLAVHFVMEGNLIHKDSDEAKRQLARQKVNETLQETKENFEKLSKREMANSPEESEITNGEDSDADESSLSKKTTGDESGKKLINQFNYCERASQTYNNPLRDRGTVTEPPPRANFSGMVTQWVIHDSYAIDYERQQENKEKKITTTGHQKNYDRSRKKLAAGESQNQEFVKISGPIKIVERMVNQNIFDDISHDFKYYEDPSDEYRDQSGTLLPLWRFMYEKAQKMSVTSLVWSNKYHDLYAVGYGSYDFRRQGAGMICFYTLKNPSYPEYVFLTESGVMSLDLHSNYTHMMCVGFYSGSVAVYSVTQRGQHPLYESSALKGKHTDPVWQVKWLPHSADSNMNFFSVSADGRVTLWTLLKEGVGAFHNSPNELVHQNVVLLTIPTDSMDVTSGSRLVSYGSGTTIDFHKTQNHMFIVGTEEGLIHKCSTAYSSQYLMTYQGHHMAVYRVVWNNFHPDVFISCSADWTVKIWTHEKMDPVFVFDLGSPVGDVAWSPYSSTVFSAVNAEGKVFVFDLNVNKFEPLCEQLVAHKKKSRLTHVVFNPIYPIILIGDDRGYTSSFKLSPNLRRMPKEKKGAAPTKGPEQEIQKLNKILALMG